MTERFLLGAAVRFEDYSDFGNTITGKLSARFDFSDAFALRGTRLHRLPRAGRAAAVLQPAFDQPRTPPAC